MLARHANPAPARSRFFTLLVAALLYLCAPAPAQSFNAAAKREILDDLQSTLTQKAYVGGVRFSEWPGHETKYFDQLDNARTPEAFAGVVNAVLAEFGVSHAALMPPSAIEERDRSEVIGIGIAVLMTNSGLRVIRVLPGSPAAASPIAPGDIILEIDGQRPKAADDLSGKTGSTVTLRLRKLSGEHIETRVVRKLIQTRTPATLTILDDQGRKIDPPSGEAAEPAPHCYGLIRLPTFFQGYDEVEINDIFTRSLNLTGLIIDLRGNGGGAITYTQHFLSFMIIEETPIGVAVSSEMAAKFVEATKGDPSDVIKVAAWSPDKLLAPHNPIRPFPGPIVVLLDGGSASASELAALALRESRGARIAGRTSAGALLVSQFFPLPHGFQAQVPISDYVSAGGVRPEGVGITPDLDPAGRTGRPGVDADVDVALDWLAASTQTPRP